MTLTGAPPAVSPARGLNKLFAPYGLAILAVVAATVVRFPLERFLLGRAPYALYYLALLVTAWYGGPGPTVVATLLSLGAAWLFFIPREDPGYPAAIALFLLVSSAMAAMADAARRTRETARQALAEAERAFEDRAALAAIVESSDDGILTKDLNSIIRTWNAGAERIFGYRADEMIGRSITTLIPADRQSEEAEIIARIQRGERVDHFETVRLGKNGRDLQVSVTISPVRDRSGVIVGASKIVRDITERRRAEQALSAQREWFRVTLSSIGDAVITSDRNANVTFLNGVAERLTGWSSREAVGRPLSEVFRIVNEKTRQPVADPVDNVLRSGRVLGLANHSVLVCRGGNERPIEDSAAPILDDDGQIVGVVLVFHDVTEQRAAEEALAEQREWFERTLGSIGDAVIATDVRGQVVFMNPVAEHLTGWRSADASRKPCDDVFHIVNEQTRRPAVNPVARVLQEGVVVGLANHTVLIAADGTESPIDDSAAPIRNRAGRVTGVVLVFRDVSERRRAEAERAQAAFERERLLESERQARAEAERSSRIKDEFVAMVSHELRTPLNAILGWTQMMTMSTKPDDVRRGLDVIQRNTRLQAQLISDLLDVSRIVAGKLRLDLGEVDLAAIVEDAVVSAQVAARAKNIHVERALDDDVGVTNGDSARLLQCVSNLLSNAIKFTPEGGHVSVTLRRVDSHAELKVSDTGIGIRPDFLPYVFERFQQAESQTTRRFGGLGLGLAIVKQLVQMHGGHVRAESNGEGKGAAFTLELPIASAQAAPPPPHGSEGRKVEPSSLAGVRVLVVEDDADTRELLRRVLEEQRAEVVPAATAAEALNALEAARPHILLSDIGLPDVDGYELMRRIRERAPTRSGAIPAIALTAYARSEDRTKALRAGYQAHIAKPVEPAELVASIASLAGLVAGRRDSDADV